MKQKTKPFISVIIDNYNYAHFLPCAINSVLAQDYSNYEIIVVDDASTDHSRDIINAYREKVRILFLEKNGGQGNAFNAAFKIARGEIISFLDADDVFLPTKLTHVATTAMRDPKAILIYHRAFTVDKFLQDLNAVFPKKLWRGHVKNIVLKTSESLFPPTSQLSFRRSFLEKVLPLDNYFSRIDADFPLQMLAGLFGRVAAIPYPLSQYRLHGDNWFSNDEFLLLDRPMIRHLMRRAEKAFYYINKKLSELNYPDRLDIFRHRHYRRNAFIFDEIKWLDYLYYPFINPNFEGLWDRIGYLKFGIDKRKKFKSKLG